MNKCLGGTREWKRGGGERESEREMNMDCSASHNLKSQNLGERKKMGMNPRKRRKERGRSLNQWVGR